jgi:hypothetical protein
MDKYKNFNAIAIMLPFFLAIFGIIDNTMFLFAILSTILTGIIQVIISLIMLFNDPLDRFLQIYVVAVVFFFVTWFVNSQTGYNNIITYCLLPIPIVLAIYLTIIIHKKIKQ